MAEVVRQIDLKEYFAAAGSIYTDKDAMLIGPELEKLAQQGKSTARDIVKSAEDKTSPLHNYFEWRDAVAAQYYREHQARVMVASVVVKVVDGSGEEKAVRAFHSAKTLSIDTAENRKGLKQHPYVTIDMVKQDRQIADQVIKDALNQLVSWKAKYSTYRSLFKEFQQFNAVFDAINQLEESV